MPTLRIRPSMCCAISMTCFKSGIALVDLLEVGHALQRMRNRRHPTGSDGNELGNTVCLAQGHILAPARHRAAQLWPHRAIGDDLRSIFAPIFVGNIVYDLLAAAIRKVGVYIGHFQSLRAEETLKE